MKLWNRRELLALSAALGLSPRGLFAAEDSMMARPIHGTLEKLPLIGLGTYSVFDVDSTPENIQSRKEIVELLIDRGGSLIDSSPMYNRSEKVIGDVVSAGAPRDKLFIATKVWTDGKASGEQQMARSGSLMNADVIDLMQVHNLRDLDVHMGTIREWKQDGRIRYDGVTDYRASALDDLERAIERHKPEFIQINYSLGETEADKRLLPLCLDQGANVIVNRPFVAGRLFRTVGDRPVPDWASDYADSWGQFFLKWIVSHPAVNCVIPATSKTRHMVDNLGAGFGEMPDAEMRERMQNYINDL